MKQIQKSLLFLVIILILNLAGCSVMSPAVKGSVWVLSATDTVSQGTADSMYRTVDAWTKSMEDITPEQEYYIGRAVGAVILKKYKVYNNPSATQYVNLIGQSLSLASERPVLYKGYRFIILDTEDLDAFSTPSGLVMISRGMLKLCKTEGEVAAVLAHEVAHIQYKHALKAIKNARITQAFSNTALTTASVASKGEMDSLTNTFGDTVNDVVGKVVNSGYSRSAEEDTDRGAVHILEKIGYNPESLTHVLQAMEKGWKSDGKGFFKTHPNPKDRIEVVEDEIGDFKEAGPKQTVVEARFQRYMRNL